MTKFLLLAGAAAIAAAPAIAKPGGGHVKSHTTTTTIVHPNGYETHSRTVTKGHSSKVTAKVRPSRTIAPHDQLLAHKYGGALCPPGLYKKTPSCMPPGQAKRLFRTGQRVSPNYKYYTPYGDIPAPLVTQYGLTDQYHYIYRNNVIYVVDPVTNLVTRIINGVL
jgi:hypothetical protein